MIDATTLALPWRERNAALEAETRAFLGRRAASAYPLTTMQISAFLVSDTGDTPKLASILTRLAPHMQGFATHDGEPVMRYGRTWQRWQWRGQYKGE